MKDHLPKGRMGRLARLAMSGARTGGALLFSRDSAKSALDSAAVLGQLRGVAAKVGQMVSYVDGLVPVEHRDAFESSMTRLQSATTASSPESIRHLLHQELGKPVEEAFGRWEDTPIASASIGQVHRAWLKDGTPVVVKVHHPGIPEALEADLRNAGLLEMAVSATMGTAKFESKRLVEELKERLREELDYTREAESQRRFAQIHADDPLIHIPAVIDELSTARVLTSEFVEGRSFQEIQGASLEDRRLWAETLWRFVYRGILCEGLFNADPHPGNYFFHDEGRISFIDFGCIQVFGEERRLSAVRLHRAAHAGDMETFHSEASAILQTRGGDYDQLMFDYLRNSFLPIMESPFHLTRDYSASLVHQFRDMCLRLLKGSNDDYVPMPPGLLFTNRLQFGFYSVLARLDVEVDYAAVERGFLKQAGGELDEPSGT